MVEFGSKLYNKTGWSDNTKIKSVTGRIIRVSAEDINRFETDNSKYPYYGTYIARIKQLVPEKSSPDGMAVLERLSTMTAPRKPTVKELLAQKDAVQRRH